MSTHAAASAGKGKMPGQIPYIIGNEACERFSFYGMRNILVQFLITSLLLQEITAEGRAGEAKDIMHSFMIGVYFFPLLGGWLADRYGRRALLAVTAAGIAVFSGFAPQLLDGGPAGELAYMILGFILLGLSFGQASGAIASSFSLKNRYTASALTSDLAWLFGAGFAPLAALALSGKFGLVAGGAYLLSGAICTLLALWLNRELAKGRAGAKA